MRHDTDTLSVRAGAALNFARSIKSLAARARTTFRSFHAQPTDPAFRISFLGSLVRLWGEEYRFLSSCLYGERNTMLGQPSADLRPRCKSMPCIRCCIELPDWTDVLEQRLRG